MRLFMFDNQKSALSGGVFLSLIYCPDVTSSETDGGLLVVIHVERYKNVYFFLKIMIKRIERLTWM